jgi:hypothetical protein
MNEDYLYKVLTIFKGRIVKVNSQWVTKKKENHMKPLEGYQPEAPDAGGDFQAFKYKGKVAIEKSVISDYDGKSSDYYSTGQKVINITAIVLEGDFVGRKLFKRFNLDSEKRSGKKEQTPVEKLADQFFAVGLTFTTLEELEVANEQFAGMEIVVSAWAADFKDGRPPMQMWNMKEVAGQGSTVSTGASAF